MRDAIVDFTAESTGIRSPFLTYEPYYGLKDKAFSLSADPRFLYKSRTHAPMFDALRAGIRRREGIIVLTGEPGTGKMMLCRSVIAARGSSRLRRAALLVTIGVMLAGSGLALNEWELRRQALAQPVPLPIVTAPTPPRVSAGPAPVIPPAEFFAPVLP